MNTWQIARVDEQGNKTYITGALMLNEAQAKVNDLVRSEGAHKNDFSIDIFMPNREVVKDEVKVEAPTDGWPTSADLVKYMKGLAQDDLDEGEFVDIDDLNELLEMADMLFPDFPNEGYPSKQDADAALEAYHDRAVGIMNKAKAEITQWLEAQESNSTTEQTK